MLSLKQLVILKTFAVMCTCIAEHTTQFSVLLAESNSSSTYKRVYFRGQGLHELERAPPLPGSWAVAVPARWDHADISAA